MRWIKYRLFEWGYFLLSIVIPVAIGWIFLWCRSDVEPATSQKIGLGLDAIGFLLIAIPLLGRKEYADSWYGTIGWIGWTKRHNYTDAVSRLDVLAAKIGAGLVTTGFIHQIAAIW
jgi:hypothetical protein